MDKINPLFTATATAIGGRNGHTETIDRLVKADLSVPKAMGGQISPEQQRPSTYSLLATRPASAARSISSPSKRRETCPRPR
jgi:organic hydroperoxide reductase OsmC/OhrA